MTTTTTAPSATDNNNNDDDDDVVEEDRTCTTTTYTTTTTNKEQLMLKAIDCFNDVIKSLRIDVDEKWNDFDRALRRLADASKLRRLEERRLLQQQQQQQQRELLERTGAEGGEGTAAAHRLSTVQRRELDEAQKRLDVATTQQQVALDAISAYEKAYVASRRKFVAFGGEFDFASSDSDDQQIRCRAVLQQAELLAAVEAEEKAEEKAGGADDADAAAAAAPSLSSRRRRRTMSSSVTG